MKRIVFLFIYILYVYVYGLRWRVGVWGGGVLSVALCRGVDFQCFCKDTAFFVPAKDAADFSCGFFFSCYIPERKSYIAGLCVTGGEAWGMRGKVGLGLFGVTLQVRMDKSFSVRMTDLFYEKYLRA